MKKNILVNSAVFLIGFLLSYFIFNFRQEKRISVLECEIAELKKDNDTMPDLAALKSKVSRLTQKMDYDKKIYVQSLQNLIKKTPRDYISKVKSKKKYIALTFDDGPHEIYTQNILDILKRYNISATFFVVGQQVKKYPALLRAEILSGHEIGNHTYSHRNMTTLDNFSVVYELETVKDLVMKEAGYEIKYFRPGGGQYDSRVLDIAKAMGYKTILWSRNTKDYKAKSSKEVYDLAVEKIGKGEIILCHDGVQETIDSLPGIIENLQKKGYSFVTVTDLINDSKGKD